MSSAILRFSRSRQIRKMWWGLHGRTRRESAVSGPSAREGLTKNMAADTIMDVSEQALETINNKGQI